jgi:hypothetical protein
VASIRARIWSRSSAGFEPAEGIEQAAVLVLVDQRAIVVLAVDFDQLRTDLAQQRGADRLIVGKGAGAPVRRLDAAQDHLALGVDLVVGKNPADRMVGGDVENRGHLPLRGAGPDQAGIAAAAKGQRQRIEQDGLARAGLAGQHRQAADEIDLKPFDEDDVADRKGGEHEGTEISRGSWQSGNRTAAAARLRDPPLAPRPRRTTGAGRRIRALHASLAESGMERNRNRSTNPPAAQITLILPSAFVIQLPEATSGS